MPIGRQLPTGGRHHIPMPVDLLAGNDKSHRPRPADFPADSFRRAAGRPAHPLTLNLLKGHTDPAAGRASHPLPRNLLPGHPNPAAVRIQFQPAAVPLAEQRRVRQTPPISVQRLQQPFPFPRTFQRTRQNFPQNPTPPQPRPPGRFNPVGGAKIKGPTSAKVRPLLPAIKAKERFYGLSIAARSLNLAGFPVCFCPDVPAIIRENPYTAVLRK